VIRTGATQRRVFVQLGYFSLFGDAKIRTLFETTKLQDNFNIILTFVRVAAIHTPPCLSPSFRTAKITLFYDITKPQAKKV
jgi:hypothetical protein